MGLFFATNTSLAINVDDFTAKGDGTSNDATAITAALAAVTALGGGILVFHPGKVYAHSATITIPANVTVQGYGAELKATDATNQQVIINGDNVKLLGLKFSSTNSGAKGSPHKIQTVGSSLINNLLIKDIEVSGAIDMGIVIGNVNGLRVENCYIHDTNADGIHITNTVTNFVINGNIISNTGDDNIAVVSNQTNGAFCTKGVISNNICTGNRTTLANAVANTAGRNIAIAGGKDIIVSNNMCSNSNNAAIMVMSDTNGNTYGCEDIQILGNEIINSNTQSTAGHADIYVLSLNGSSFPINRTTIKNNKVRNNTLGDGIKIGSNTNQTEIIANDVYMVTGANGITIGGTANDVRIISNRVARAAQDGINVASTVTGYVIIQQNMIDAANDANTGTHYGICVNPAAGVTRMIALGNMVRVVNTLTMNFGFGTVLAVNYISDNYQI